MTWRGQTTPLDRFFACLVYLLPMVEVYAFGTLLLSLLGPLQILFLPLGLIAGIYFRIVGAIPFGSFIVFLVLLFAVVRNERIRHFVRFNTMQAILIGIFISIISILWRLISVLPIFGGGTGSFLTLIITTILFVGTMAICIYAIVQSIRGKYAEIPQLSDAAYIQVR